MAIAKIWADCIIANYFPIEKLHSVKIFRTIAAILHAKTIFFTNDEDEAIAEAVKLAKQMHNEFMPVVEEDQDGFEHEGMWITDRMMSPCGRFELTEEQSKEIYGGK